MNSYRPITRFTYRYKETAPLASANTLTNPPEEQELAPNCHTLTNTEPPTLLYSLRTDRYKPLPPVIPSTTRYIPPSILKGQRK
jgi:hypothetical protein